jgi:hypothetical protein
MAWKATIPLVGGGAAMAAGFLWARHAMGPRGPLPQASRLASSKRKAEPAGLPDINLDPDVNLDAIALSDALHDMGELNDDVDFDADTKRTPMAVEPTEEIEMTVGPNEHAVPGDEPYDALDAEDVGTAWLRRATGSEPTEAPDATAALDGMHEVTEESELDIELLELEREGPYGADQAGEPLAPYAGTHESDIAAELPVGTFDAAGNAELRVAQNPPDALEAPATGALSTTEEEITRRDAAHAIDQRRTRR